MVSASSQQLVKMWTSCLTERAMNLNRGEFSVKEILRENYNVYYRITEDGVEFASPVYIDSSQKITHGEQDLKDWCKSNAHRLTDGKIVHADLNEARIR